MEEMQRNSFDEMANEIDARMQEKAKEQKRKNLEKQKQKREEEFSRGLEKLADRVLERENDQDSTTYTLLKTFLDVATELQDLMKDLNSINDAMTCLTDAIGFLDSAIDLDQQLVDESLSHRYGFRERLKLKRKNKKAIRNNTGRMLALADSIYLKFDMASGMSEAMAKMGIKVKAKMDKAQAKAKKRMAKRGDTQKVQATRSKADALLERRRQERNGGNSDDTQTPPPAPSAPAGNGSGASFDDIL